MNYLVTGCTGFVGQYLVRSLLVQHNTKVVCVGRNEAILPNAGFIKIDDINGSTNWIEALKNIDIVIHLAARVHVMNEISANPITEFRKVNVDGTKQLAMQAAKAGVKRFVYVSSIKVNGEKTSFKPFEESDPTAPEDAYGISKYEAELMLQEVAKNTGLEVVIIRPPLIYGPGVKGNFLQLIKVLRKRIPLPFGSINNLRSLLYVGNLVDALILCATHPAAAGKTYLISDGEDISTPGLVELISESLGFKAHLLKCPVFILNALGKITRKKEQINRLSESLQVDNSKIQKELGWKPKFTLREGLRKTLGTY